MAFAIKFEAAGYDGALASAVGVGSLSVINYGAIFIRPWTLCHFVVS